MTYRDLTKAVAKIDFDASLRLPEKYDAQAVAEAETPSEALLCAFRWSETPEGVEYWGEIYDRLKDMEEGEEGNA